MIKKICYLSVAMLLFIISSNALGVTAYIVNTSDNAIINTIKDISGKTPSGFPSAIPPNSIAAANVSLTITTLPIFIGDEKGNGCYFTFNFNSAEQLQIGGGIGIGNLEFPGCQIGRNQAMIGVDLYSGHQKLGR